jgi:hypothetical protein
MNGNSMRAARAEAALEPVPARGAARRLAPIALVPTQGARPLADVAPKSRLLRQLEATTTQPSLESMAALRAVLTDVVDHLKAQGLSMGRVVAVVEALIGEPAATPRVLPIRGGTSAAPDEARMRARLLHWCVQAYRDDAWW